jgi:argininosuccinate lyase
VIASTASRAISESKTAEEITVEMIEEAALEGLGRKLGMSEEELRLAIDPLENVRRRKAIGGPAPEEVKRMIDDRRAKIKREELRNAERRKRLEEAYKELGRAEGKIRK